MSDLTPEQGGRDYDHLLSEYRHLVAELERTRERLKTAEKALDTATRERSASAAYAVRLEDALRGLYVAGLDVLDTIANLDESVVSTDQAVALAEALTVTIRTFPGAAS